MMVVTHFDLVFVFYKPVPVLLVSLKPYSSRTYLHALVSCLIYARALLEYVIFIWLLHFVNKMLPSVKFTEDKVLTFLILREKCKNSATLTDWNDDDALYKLIIY